VISRLFRAVVAIYLMTTSVWLVWPEFRILYDTSFTQTFRMANAILLIGISFCGLGILVSAFWPDPTEGENDEDLQLESTIRQLELMCAHLRSQATLAIYVAGGSIFVGFLVVGAGIYLAYLGHMQIAVVSTGSGLITEVVTVLGFYLFRSTSARIDVATRRFQNLSTLMLLFDQAREIPDPSDRVSATQKIINNVLGSSKASRATPRNA